MPDRQPPERQTTDEAKWRIVQVNTEDFRIETRRRERVFFFWEDWSDWERLGITHYYEYHNKRLQYTWKSEEEAREYIANLEEEDRQREERKKTFPKIINY